ncbi:hypothetical protein DFH06DRAFT_1348733 [Mycena polygramma]|nr:hypothetical protein DFH06DRAFT_1348733 [Mycena polygramma]
MSGNRLNRLYVPENRQPHTPFLPSFPPPSLPFFCRIAPIASSLLAVSMVLGLSRVLFLTRSKHDRIWSLSPTASILVAPHPPTSSSRKHADILHIFLAPDFPARLPQTTILRSYVVSQWYRVAQVANSREDLPLSRTMCRCGDSYDPVYVACDNGVRDLRRIARLGPVWLRRTIVAGRWNIVA